MPGLLLRLPPTLLLLSAFWLTGCQSASPEAPHTAAWTPPRSGVFAGDPQVRLLAGDPDGPQADWRDRRAVALGRTPLPRYLQEDVRVWHYEGQRGNSRGQVTDRGYRAQWIRRHATLSTPY